MMGRRIWRIGSQALNVAPKGLIMGVLNVTPDSFSEGGRFTNEDAAVAHGIAMAQQGADIIDIGGESSRPGAVSISEDEEKARVLPVIRRLRAEVAALLSIDTCKAEVAEAALDAGADMVNDITAGADPKMLPLIAQRKAAVVLMHMQGTPKTMQDSPKYSDVVAEISNFFRQRYACALDCGVDPMAIAFDPGIGFGKTLEHNLALLGNLSRLRVEDRPMVVGVSRKGFLRKILGDTMEGAGLIGTVALTALLRSKGADAFRVHDVIENVQALRLTNALGAA
jgi:dihydropteroate synthase